MPIHIEIVLIFKYINIVVGIIDSFHDLNPKH